MDTPNPEIDTTNRFFVAMRGNQFVVLRPPTGAISADDALLLPAWLVALADDHGRHSFADVLAAVMDT